MKPKGSITPSEALTKAARYCAYQERSQQEVRDKLYAYGLYQDEVEEVLTRLIMEDFINEERFAKSYVSGKFRMKKWGRKKILQGLKNHRVSDYCVKKGFQEIDETDYLNVLEQLLEKKRGTLHETDAFVEKQKLARYAIGKGYESELVWEILKE